MDEEEIDPFVHMDTLIELTLTNTRVIEFNPKWICNDLNRYILDWIFDSRYSPPILDKEVISFTLPDQSRGFYLRTFNGAMCVIKDRTRVIVGLNRLAKSTLNQYGIDPVGNPYKLSADGRTTTFEQALNILCNTPTANEVSLEFYSF